MKCKSCGDVTEREDGFCSEECYQEYAYGFEEDEEEEQGESEGTLQEEEDGGES